MGSMSFSSCICCMFCASCASPQCCVLHDLQFVNAGQGVDHADIFCTLSFPSVWLSLDKYNLKRFGQKSFII